MTADTEHMVIIVLDMEHTFFALMSIKDIHTHTHVKAASLAASVHRLQPPSYWCLPWALQSVWQGWRGKNNNHREVRRKALDRSSPSIITSTASHTQSCFHVIPSPKPCSVARALNQTIIFGKNVFPPLDSFKVGVSFYQTQIAATLFLIISQSVFTAF